MGNIVDICYVHAHPRPQFIIISISHRLAGDFTKTKNDITLWSSLATCSRTRRRRRRNRKRATAVINRFICSNFDLVEIASGQSDSCSGPGDNVRTVHRNCPFDSMQTHGVQYRPTWGDSDVILSAVVAAAMLEVYVLQQCNVASLRVLANCCV